MTSCEGVPYVTPADVLSKNRLLMFLISAFMNIYIPSKHDSCLTYNDFNADSVLGRERLVPYCDKRLQGWQQLQPWH